jgi:branched-subunit amino acid aminotransferase/4-amino-4-deoxychorismate lyase
VTPKADDLILHGVTRDSVLALSREFNRFPVVERDVTIDELILSV